MNMEEFNIPVPWGNIAVKAWGHKNNKPVLLTHGRMDNAGSFDRLIPFLPNSFYYICIDLPSHGHSSRFPPFLPIHTLNFVIAYKLVLDYFKREKYILLGHSLGAIIGNYFTQLYPEYIEKVIGIDSATSFLPVGAFKDYLTDIYNSIIYFHNKQATESRKTYTREEAVQKICDGRWGEPLTPEAATPLVERMMEPIGNGKYHLAVDQRMLAPMYPLHDKDYLIETLRLYPITCPYLLIMCKRSSSITFAQPVIDEYKKNSNFKLQWVEGSHDVHISEPEIIAPYISDFLIKSLAKL